MKMKKMKYQTGGEKNQTAAGVGGKSNPNSKGVFDVSPARKMQTGGVINSKLELNKFPVPR
jgi:hypothetical protein